MWAISVIIFILGYFILMACTKYQLSELSLLNNIQLIYSQSEMSFSDRVYESCITPGQFFSFPVYWSPPRDIHSRFQLVPHGWDDVQQERMCCFFQIEKKNTSQPNHPECVCKSFSTNVGMK